MLSSSDADQASSATNTESCPLHCILIDKEDEKIEFEPLKKTAFIARNLVASNVAVSSTEVYALGGIQIQSSSKSIEIHLIRPGSSQEEYITTCRGIRQENDHFKVVWTQPGGNKPVTRMRIKLSGQDNEIDFLRVTASLNKPKTKPVPRTTPYTGMPGMFPGMAPPSFASMQGLGGMNGMAMQQTMTGMPTMQQTVDKDAPQWSTAISGLAMMMKSMENRITKNLNDQINNLRQELIVKPVGVEVGTQTENVSSNEVGAQVEDSE